MQHSEADQTLAVERYLLGDMTASEVEQFEEHLFLCPECAESVKSGTVFIKSVRAVFVEPTGQVPQGATRQAIPQKRAAWWKAWWAPSFAPACAALALAFVVGYQQLVVIRGMRTQLAEVTGPQPLASFTLHSVSRGAAPSIAVPVDAHFFELHFDVAVESASGYSCALLDGTGAVKFTQHLSQPRPEAGGALNLLIARSGLPAGDYTLVVSIASPHPAEISRYPFKVKYP